MSPKDSLPLFLFFQTYFNLSYRIFFICLYSQFIPYQTEHIHSAPIQFQGILKVSNLFPWHLFVIQCTFIQLFYSCIYCLINNLCTHYIFSDLERAWVGCAIASAGIQIFAILTMICGLWPADCANAKRSTLYLVTSILCLIAGNHSYKNYQFVSH